MGRTRRHGVPAGRVEAATRVEIKDPVEVNDRVEVGGRVGNLPGRMLALLLGVGALAVVGVVLPLDATAAAIASLGPVAGVAVGTALLVALVPRTPVSIACGVIFGAATGTICALAIALAAAAATFAAGRWLGRDFVARYAGRRWRRLEAWSARQGALAVAAVRALPLGPYGLAGYAYGAAGARVRDYGLGTLVAATPSAVTYALVGAAVARPGTVNPVTALPLAIGVLLWVAVAVRSRRATVGAPRAKGV